MTDVADDAGLRCEVAVPVATITLCRPEVRNAQSPRMWASLATMAASLPESVRVVVVRAEGESFSAGLDRRLFTPAGIPGERSLLELLSLDDAALERRIEGFQAAFTWQRRAELITVAAVQGHAVGAGFQLALACDLRVVAEDVRFSMRETSLGFVPDLGGTQPLVEQVGYARALEICVTGREVGAREALELGLATVAVPRGDLEDAVDDLVAALLAAGHDAVRATKALLREASHRSFADQLAAERSAQLTRLRALGRDPGGIPGGNKEA